MLFAALLEPNTVAQIQDMLHWLFPLGFVGVGIVCLSARSLSSRTVLAGMGAFVIALTSVLQWFAFRNMVFHTWSFDSTQYQLVRLAISVLTLVGIVLLIFGLAATFTDIRRQSYRSAPVR